MKRFYPITVHNGCRGYNSGICNRVSTNECVRSTVTSVRRVALAARYNIYIYIYIYIKITVLSDVMPSSIVG
jgi:hypothetical protein